MHGVLLSPEPRLLTSGGPTSKEGSHPGASVPPPEPEDRKIRCSGVPGTMLLSQTHFLTESCRDSRG